MEFPFGHHRHHERREEQEAYPPPPSAHHHQHHGPPEQPNFGYPPPPRHISHEVNHPEYNYSLPTYPPPPLHVQHISRDFPHVPPPVVYPPPSPPDQHHHHHNIHLPSFIHHHSHEGGGGSTDKPTVRVFCKAETGYSLTIRDGRVILARSDPNDMFQHWIKDEKYSTKVKDEQGFPSFALVNKATGQAIKHSIGNTHPVQLIQYNPDKFDESILWTESNGLGDGYRTIRMINNIRLNLDAFNGDKNHGGVHDGTIAVLWEWKKGDNQRWKIIPY